MAVAAAHVNLHDSSPRQRTRRGRQCKVAGFMSIERTSFIKTISITEEAPPLAENRTTQLVSGAFLLHAFSLAVAVQAEIALWLARTYWMDGLDGHWIRLEL